MPYPGIPESKTPKMEDCVNKVMDQGKAKSNSIAICHDSIMGKMSKKQVLGKLWAEMKANPLKFKVSRMMAKCGKKETRARFHCAYRKVLAQHSTLGGVPTDAKKKLVGQEMSASYSKYNFGTHGSFPQKHLAQFELGMRNYALLDVIFLRDGTFNTNGKEFHHPWDVIERDGKSFEGKAFNINHPDPTMTGTEYGIIDKIYTKMVDGVKWLAAEIKIPETGFTKSTLERIENGLINAVSSTHILYVDPEKQSNDVDKISGQGISLVREPEVEGARILSLKRNIRGESDGRSK